MVTTANAQSPLTQSISPYPAPERIRLDSQSAAWHLIAKVPPVYPPRAIQAGISGTVRIQIVIGTDGRVQHAEIVTGNPALVQSALDSINKWRYYPAVLNSSPVEIFTTVDLEYRLTQQVVVRGPPIDPILRADIGKLLDVTGAEEQEARKLIGMIRGRLFRSIGDETERKKWIDLYEQKLIKNFKTDQYRIG